MTAPVRRPATPDGLMLWVMHRFAEVFGQHAILKGGMALRLYDCPRSTTDIDYVFVPFESKNDIVDGIRSTLEEIEGAAIELGVHSKMLRATIALDSARVQVEVNVSPACASDPMSTAGFAAELGQPAQVVRVMSAPTALAHKLAAWNERRLQRDLYDIYFLRTRAGAEIERAVLASRLRRVESRLPRLRKVKSMTFEQLADELQSAAAGLDERELRTELGAVLPATELAGIAARLRAALVSCAEQLRQANR